MKITICGDIHISETSSIVKKNGDKYSARLENIIDSVWWMNNESSTWRFQLGDIMDRATVTGNELTAMTKMDFSGWTCIAGNHCLDSRGIAAHGVQCQEVITEPEIRDFKYVYVMMLPYIQEKNRKPLKDIIQQTKDKLTLKEKPLIVMSHNDIAGIQYGKYTSQQGFSIEEIEENCDLFLNGHLHNQEWVSDKILNVGNLTGQNFTEDFERYKHGIWTLDVEKMYRQFQSGKANAKECIEFKENPHAMKFKNVEIFSKRDLGNVMAISDKNTVLSITTNEEMKDEAINFAQGLMSYKILIKTEKISNKGFMEVKRVNHIDKFKSSVLDKFGTAMGGILEEIGT
jgi:predicted phosphodiesterase